MEPRYEVIQSRTNSVLKRARAVARGKEGEPVIWVEGERLVLDALARGVEPEVLLLREDRLGDLAAEIESSAGAVRSIRVVPVDLFDSISSLNHSSGVAAILPEPRTQTLEQALGGDPEATLLLLGVSGVADPGNLGALARCAEAAGANAMIVVRGGARPFGPKALRGSMGSLLRLPVVLVDQTEVATAMLERAGVRQFAAATRGGGSLAAMSLPKRRCVWLTGETGEAPPAFAGLDPVTVPMQGSVESLNVTVAGALMLFAAAGVLS